MHNTSHNKDCSIPVLKYFIILVMQSRYDTTWIYLISSYLHHYPLCMPSSLQVVYLLGSNPPSPYTIKKKNNQHKLIAGNKALTHKPTGKHFPQHSVFEEYLSANQSIHYSPAKKNLHLGQGIYILKKLQMSSIKRNCEGLLLEYITEAITNNHAN